MLTVLIWWRDPSGIYVTTPDARPEGTVRLGVSVLDDEGVIRAWEVMKAQTEVGPGADRGGARVDRRHPVRELVLRNAAPAAARVRTSGVVTTRPGQRGLRPDVRGEYNYELSKFSSTYITPRGDRVTVPVL